MVCHPAVEIGAVPGVDLAIVAFSTVFAAFVEKANTAASPQNAKAGASVDGETTKPVVTELACSSWPQDVALVPVPGLTHSRRPVTVTLPEVK